MRRMFCKNQRSRAIECLLTESHIHGNMYVWFGGRHGETSHRNMVWRPVSSLHIDRHHMHIVTIRVDENGKCLDSRYNYHRSKAITRDLEEKYNLHKADRKQRRFDNPLRKVDVSQGNVKKQVANTVKSLCTTYRFQSLGEYRALLSLYNISLEEVRGEVGGREYHGFVYSATDGQGNKVGNPFKASKIDKSVGVETIEKRFAYSTKKFKEEKKLSEMTRHSVEAVLKQTYHKDKFVELLDTVQNFV